VIGRKDKNVQFSEYADHFTNHIISVDKLRMKSLQRLQKIRNKRGKSQQRQLGRLASKYGEKHPRVLRQAERVINEKEMENYLSLIIDKADCDINSIKDSFILHGRVVADDIKGLSGIRVQLLDAKNNIIGKPVKTDNKGFYVLVIDVDDSISSNRFNIVVLDKKGEQLHKEKLPILVVADSIESRDIVIAKLDKLGRDKNILLKEVLNSSKPIAKRKASTGVKSVRKTVKKSKTRKKASKKT
jgi:hypothetical protein